MSQDFDGTGNNCDWPVLSLVSLLRRCLVSLLLRCLLSLLLRCLVSLLLRCLVSLLLRCLLSLFRRRSGLLKLLLRVSRAKGGVKKRKFFTPPYLRLVTFDFLHRPPIACCMAASVSPVVFRISLPCNLPGYGKLPGYQPP